MRKRFGPLSGVAAAMALLLGLTMAPAQAAIPTSSLEPGDVVGTSAVVPYSSEERVADWQKLQFGLFMHWGVYSMFEGVYEGKVQTIGYPEQIKAWLEIPDDVYLATAAEMSADKWDAAAVCQMAKDTGMKYVMITTKHHDGFAMWDTATTDYDVVEQTAFGQDPIAQLAEACSAIDIKLAFYFSIIDWTQHEPEPWQNVNPIPETMMPLIKAQVTELLTNYGPIAEFWFDMGGPTADQSGRMAQWVHDLQPATMVNSRVWNDKGDFEVGGDNRVPNEFRMGPWESILSVFPQCWSYCSTFKANRAATNLLPKSKELVWGLVRVVSGGGQFAYNIGPKGDGSIDPFDRAVLANAGDCMDRHPDAITGARPTWFPAPTWGRVTANGDDLYFFVNTWADRATITLPGLANEVTSVTIDGTDQALEFTRTGLDLSVTLKGASPDELMPVLKVSLDGAPAMVPAQTVAIDGRTAQIATTNVVDRLSAKGTGFVALDSYVLNTAGENVAVILDVDATRVSAATLYRVWFDDRSVEVTGAQLVGGPIEMGAVLAPDAVGRIRIEYADPTYYANALDLTGVTVGVSVRTAGESVTALQGDLADYIASGEVAGPIAKQLTQALAQAQRHVAAGRMEAAASAVANVMRLLDQPKRPDTLSQEAAADLREQAHILADLIG